MASPAKMSNTQRARLGGRACARNRTRRQESSPAWDWLGREAERDALLFQLRDKHSLAELGRMVGLSRQAVHKILRRGNGRAA